MSNSRLLEAKIALKISDLLVHLGLDKEQACFLYDRMIDGFSPDDDIYSEILLRHLTSLSESVTLLLNKNGGIR